MPGSQAAMLKESDEEEYARYMRPKSAEELGAKLMQTSFSSEAPDEVWDSNRALLSQIHMRRFRCHMLDGRCMTPDVGC